MSIDYTNLLNEPQEETPHTPDKRIKDNVTYWSGLGLRPSEIARLVEVSPAQLHTHYRDELAVGPAEANLQVCENLFKMAVSPNYPAVAMFWARTRCGFKPGASSSFEHPLGMPPPPEVEAGDEHATIEF